MLLLEHLLLEMMEVLLGEHYHHLLLAHLLEVVLEEHYHLLTVLDYLRQNHLHLLLA